MKGQLGMTLNKIADAIKILDGFALETLENNSNIKLYTIEGTYYLKVKNKKKRLVEVKLNENTNWKNYYLMGSTFGGSALLLNHINKGMYIELVEITKKDYYTRLLEYFHLQERKIVIPKTFTLPLVKDFEVYTKDRKGIERLLVSYEKN